MLSPWRHAWLLALNGSGRTGSSLRPHGAVPTFQDTFGAGGECGGRRGWDNEALTGECRRKREPSWKSGSSQEEGGWRPLSCLVAQKFEVQ